MLLVLPVYRICILYALFPEEKVIQQYCVGARIPFSV